MSKHYKIIPCNDPRVLVLEFKKTIPMALMFMRLQEYTEGIKPMRDNILTEGDSILAYYKKRKKIWYKAGWAGFNLRGDTLHNIWLNHRAFTTWNKLEEELWELTKPYRESYGTKFYVISYVKGEKSTLKHEWHHAMYYLNSVYRFQVDKVLNKRKHKKAKKYLTKLGYGLKGDVGQYIFLDEIQAYHSEHDKPTTKALGLNKKEIKQLDTLSKRYCKWKKA
jgi:hypothetical protein